MSDIHLLFLLVKICSSFMRFHLIADLNPALPTDLLYAIKSCGNAAFLTDRWLVNISSGHILSPPQIEGNLKSRLRMSSTIPSPSSLAYARIPGEPSILFDYSSGD